MSKAMQAIALWVVLVGMAVGGFAMALSTFSHNESRERQDISKATQELQKK